MRLRNHRGSVVKTSKCWLFWEMHCSRVCAGGREEANAQNVTMYSALYNASMMYSGGATGTHTPQSASPMALVVLVSEVKPLAPSVLINAGTINWPPANMKTP